MNLIETLFLVGVLGIVIALFHNHRNSPSNTELVCFNKNGDVVFYAQGYPVGKDPLVYLTNGVYKNKSTGEKLKADCNSTWGASPGKGREYWESKERSKRVMTPKEFLDKVSYIADSDIQDDDGKIYKSKFDDSYITRVGMENNIEFLAEREITEQLTPGIGYSPKDNKWYGWSHRAIFGFEIGSTCKLGDCHYIGSSEEEQKEDAIRFWTEVYHLNVRCEGIIEKGDERYFDIKWDYTNTVPNKELRNTISGVEHFITPLGRGEWVAKTMEDAKQMAKDFNEGVS